MALSKSDKTPNIVLNLSDIMEYIVSEGDNEWISLENEINFIKNYISLEMLDFKTNNIDFKIEGDPNGIRIPPLITGYFLDNAFKNTDLTNNGIIHIKITCKKEEIVFSCINSINNKNKVETDLNDKEFKNIQMRLNSYYSDNYKLDIRNDESNYYTCLTLKNISL